MMHGSMNTKQNTLYNQYNETDVKCKKATVRKREI